MGVKVEGSVNSTILSLGIGDSFTFPISKTMAIDTAIRRSKYELAPIVPKYKIVKDFKKATIKVTRKK